MDVGETRHSNRLRWLPCTTDVEQRARYTTRHWYNVSRIVYRDRYLNAPGWLGRWRASWPQRRCVIQRPTRRPFTPTHERWSDRTLCCGRDRDKSRPRVGPLPLGTAAATSCSSSPRSRQHAPSTRSCRWGQYGRGGGIAAVSPKNLASHMLCHTYTACSPRHGSPVRIYSVYSTYSLCTAYTAIQPYTPYIIQRYTASLCVELHVPVRRRAHLSDNIATRPIVLPEA